MWRIIYSEHDCVLLQKDIDTLHDWSLKDKMHFHPENAKFCKFIITNHFVHNYYL